MCRASSWRRPGACSSHTSAPPRGPRGTEWRASRPATSWRCSRATNRRAEWRDGPGRSAGVRHHLAGGGRDRRTPQTPTSPTGGGAAGRSCARAGPRYRTNPTPSRRSSWARRWRRAPASCPAAGDPCSDHAPGRADPAEVIRAATAPRKLPTSLDAARWRWSRSGPNRRLPACRRQRQSRSRRSGAIWRASGLQRVVFAVRGDEALAAFESALVGLSWDLELALTVVLVAVVALG